jgi:hypothetical protein
MMTAAERIVEHDESITVQAQKIAYTILRNAYTRMTAWDWAAYARNHGYLDKDDRQWNEDGMDMFNRMFATAKTQDLDTARAIAYEIVTYMQGSIQETLKGQASYPAEKVRGMSVVRKYDTVLDQVVGEDSDGLDITIGDTVTCDEPGYAELEDGSVMKQRMKVLAGLLSAEDIDILRKTMIGYSNTEAAGGRLEATAWQKRVRRATSKLKGTELFRNGGA